MKNLFAKSLITLAALATLTLPTSSQALTWDIAVLEESYFALEDGFAPTSNFLFSDFGGSLTIPGFSLPADGEYGLISELGGTFDFSFGSYSFSETDDILGDPLVDFASGDIFAFTFSASTLDYLFSISGDALGSTFMDMFIYANDLTAQGFDYISGELVFTQQNTGTPVPLPATVYLLGAGFLALAGYRKKMAA